VGFLGASVFSLVYYIAPVYVLTSPLVLLYNPTAISTWIYLAPLIISAVLPCKPNKLVLCSWFARKIPKYFNYTEILEFDDEELIALTNKRACILAVCPHGIISYGGICSGLVDGEFNAPLRQQVLDAFPTAVASVVLSFPIMKHVIGIFGLIDASRKSLSKRLNDGKSFVLYPGGIAELFLSSPAKEAIIARKGFIRLALANGSDVIPIYLFGNTTVLRVFTHPVLMAVSRSLGASLTLFWGRWGLPLPLPDPLIYVRGKPLGMPKVEGEPSQALIDEWHVRYVAEVQRLFETYKHLRLDFKEKVLEVSEK